MCPCAVSRAHHPVRAPSITVCSIPLLHPHPLNYCLSVSFCSWCSFVAFSFMSHIGVRSVLWFLAVPRDVAVWTVCSHQRGHRGSYAGFRLHGPRASLSITLSKSSVLSQTAGRRPPLQQGPLRRVRGRSSFIRPPAEGQGGCLDALAAVSRATVRSGACIFTKESFQVLGWVPRAGVLVVW